MAKPDAPAKGNDIGTRTETFLGEFRMIIPAMAAILGFQLIVAFQQSFGELHPLAQLASFSALACTAVAFLLLLMPASYHRFTWEFEETEEFLRFSRRSIGAAFVFMPLTMALTLFVQAAQVFGTLAAGTVVGGATLALALVFWWVIPLRRARREGYLPHEHKGERRPERPTARGGGREAKGGGPEAKVRAR
jgi:hypothetical protein